LIRTEEERPGTAGGIEHPQFGDLIGCLPFQEFPYRVLHDVVDDVGGRVVDAASLLYFGLVFHLGMMPGGEANHLTQELFVNVAEDVGGEDGELKRTLRVVEALEDLLLAPCRRS